MISNKKTLGILFFILSYTSLIISFFFNEDGSGGGSKGDFEVTYGFIIALQNNLLADPETRRKQRRASTCTIRIERVSY